MSYQAFEKLKFSILIIIIIIINLFINIPSVSNLNLINKNLKAESNKLKAAYDLNQDADQILKNYQIIKKQIPNLNTVLLTQGSELTLIQKLETIAKNNSLGQKITLDQNIQSINDNIYKLSLRLELQGSYGNILNYLNELNKFEYQLTVGLLNLENEGDNLTLALLASTYWLYDKTKSN